MAGTIQNTFQTNIHTHQMENITDYAFFLGGLNVTRDALMQYDPLKTGFGRVFMIRKPIFVDDKIPDKLRKFKHVLEYANTGVSGNNDIGVQFNEITGGYTGRKMEIPNIVSDDSNEFTIKTYEFSGSLMREVIMYWINGVTDLQTGLSTYYQDGTEEKPLAICQANHTAEFIYVVTDQTGRQVEYACLWANCFPKNIKLDHFNYDAAQHDIVQLDIAFTGTRYISPQINAKAKQLLNKYNVLMNSLNFNSGFSDVDLSRMPGGTYYSLVDGKLRSKAANGVAENRLIIDPTVIPAEAAAANNGIYN